MKSQAKVKPHAKVSVIVPVFNAAKTLSTTLSSLLAQTYKNIELLIINDGSTDASLEIIKSYQVQSHLADFQIISINNRGAYYAREEGITRATGDYLAFCDAGDALEASFIEDMLTAAKTNSADVAVCAYKRVQGRHAHIEMASFGTQSLPVNEESGWLVSVNTSLWNKLFRREVLQKRSILKHAPRIGEDALMLHSLFPYIKKISFLEEPLYSYKTSESSTMATLTAPELDNMSFCWEQIRQEAAQINPAFSAIIDLSAMVHLGVSAPLVIAGTKGENLKECITHTTEILNRSFPEYRNNPFVKKAYVQQFPQMKKIAAMHFFVIHGLMGAGAKGYRLLNSHTNFQLGW